VGRAYAGILGPLAFLTVLAHGIFHAAGAQQTLWRATLALATFGLVGCVAGQLAGWIVEDSVRGRLTAEIAKKSAQAPAAKRADVRGATPPRAAATVKT
jgi:hypothetical protein